MSAAKRGWAEPLTIFNSSELAKHGNLECSARKSELRGDEGLSVKFELER